MRDHKLINGIPQKITSIPLDRGGVICNPREVDLIAYVCKELVIPEPPTFAYTEEYEETETQIIVKYVEVLQVVEPWHEDTNFQIKFTERNLRYMLGRVPEMVFYTNTLEDHEDLMGNVYFYVNRINDEELSLLKQFAEIYDRKGNRL